MSDDHHHHHHSFFLSLSCSRLFHGVCQNLSSSIDRWNLKNKRISFLLLSSRSEIRSYQVLSDCRLFILSTLTFVISFSCLHSARIEKIVYDDGEREREREEIDVCTSSIAITPSSIFATYARASVHRQNARQKVCKRKETKTDVLFYLFFSAPTFFSSRRRTRGREKRQNEWLSVDNIELSDQQHTWWPTSRTEGARRKQRHRPTILFILNTDIRR